MPPMNWQIKKKLQINSNRIFLMRVKFYLTLNTRMTHDENVVSIVDLKRC